MKVNTQYNVEFVGGTKMMMKIHLLLPVNAKEVWVSSISHASRTGYLLKSKKSHQGLKMKM